MKTVILFLFAVVYTLGFSQPPIEPLNIRVPTDEQMLLHKRHDEIQLNPDYRSEFPGGLDSLKKYMNMHLIYPLDFFEVTAFNTKVLISFVIEKDGKVTTAQLVKDLMNCTCCANEAVALIKRMPKWKPARSKNYFVDYLNAFKTLDDTIFVRNKWIIPIQFEKEHLPILPYGYDTLSAFINKNLVYPERALKEKIKGKVDIKLFFNDLGNLENVVLLRGIENCPECDAEVLRLFKTIPKTFIKANNSSQSPKPFFFNTCIEFKTE